MARRSVGVEGSPGHYRRRHRGSQPIRGPTVVGQLADTVVFCSIAAGAIGINTVGDFLTYVALGWLYKTAVEVVMLPVTYRVIAFTKRCEPMYQPAV
jgi:queuosine precursor transporter